MASNKKDIGKLLRKYGYAMPKSPDEVKSFEEKFRDEYSSPKKWPKIEDIISGKIPVSRVLPVEKNENNAARNLAMAAREGKVISQKDREKMDKDKKNAKRK
jgi:hypothetical protein